MRVTLGPLAHRTRDLSPPRAVRAWEADVFKLLLDDGFESIVALSQLPNALVDAECVGHCPTVWFRVIGEVPPLMEEPYGPTSIALPLTGEAVDRDGMAINALVHFADGYIRELDVHRVDGKAFLSVPSASEFRRIPT